VLWSGVTRALANIATAARLALVVPIAWAILAEREVAALGLLTVAVGTDAIDGWLARRYGTTVLGSWLDVTADRLLIGAVVGALWWSGGLAGWITLVLVLREAVVGLGALVAFAPRRPMRPLVVGKAHTACAFLLLVAAVAAAGEVVAPLVVDALAVMVTITAVLSLAAYADRVRS
jgi:phosphatidylglycerophosphate synthase